MTVGLVIVSHSEKLASGATELAQQMTKQQVAIAAAGGMGNNDLGTSADIIQHAIESVDSPDGVLVFLDMGSAVLSTEMALEMLPDEQRRRVVLTFAPVVEGAVAAALEATLSRSLSEVKAAAEQTASKQNLQNLKPITQDEEAAIESVPTNEAPLAANALEKQFTLSNPSGLHARPASLFVQAAAPFKATIEVRTSKRQARANSMSELLSLAARQGETITLRASGDDAQTALDTLGELVLVGFHETTETSPSTSRQVKEKKSDYSQSANEFHGIATSKGFALGPAFVYDAHAIALSSIERQTIVPEQVTAEQKRLTEAVEVTIKEVQALAQRMQQQVGKNEAAIFDAQAQLLNDPALLETASAIIQQQHYDAASAIAQAGEQSAVQLEALDDLLFAGRAVDIRDVVSRVIQHLGGQTSARQDFRAPGILVAHDLTPSDTAQLRHEMVLGICTMQGGPTAHTAILARALGIPAIAGLDEILLQRVSSGDELGMDAEKGIVYLQPTAEVRANLEQHIAEQKQRQDTQKAVAQQTHEPLLIDGQRIYLFANIGSAVEAEAARQWGAEGVGLLRTEFLFADRQTLPNDEEQRTSYAQVFRAFRSNSDASSPIVVRTLDAGADKPMPSIQPYLPAAKEANPALGMRGVRIQLAHPELLEQQFRSLLQAAQDEHVNLHIMVPMLTTVEELRTVRTIFERVTTSINLATPVPLGIMVEVPASVIMAAELAQIADFFSIGANDLSQYTLASDRTNTALASLYTPMQPSVLRSIRQIAEAGHAEGKLVAVCGEMASDIRLAPVLIGLGVTELSMTPNALPEIRAVLTGHTMQEFTHLANRVLQASTVAEVEQICNEFANGA